MPLLSSLRVKTLAKIYRLIFKIYQMKYVPSVDISQKHLHRLRGQSRQARSDA